MILGIPKIVERSCCVAFAVRFNYSMVYSAVDIFIMKKMI